MHHREKTVGTTNSPPPISAVSEGFDSRLQVELIGRIPVQHERAVGFEIIKGKPLVAYPHRLLGVEADKVVSIPWLDPIEGSGRRRSSKSPGSNQ
jgi:hypothetical protein